MKKLLFLFFYLISLLMVSPCVEAQSGNYVCPPCRCEAHERELSFEDDGRCPYCSMNLVERADSFDVNEIDIKTGSGNFMIEGGSGHEEKTISVFYHKPASFSAQSPILLVIPGSGRDGNEYRDAWIGHSETYSVLILSLKYPEKNYDFGMYHMGGLMQELELEGNVTYSDNSNEVFLDENNFTYKVNGNKKQWIFNDFDRLFEWVVEATGSAQRTYDMFGHSAGGQILHRFVLLHPESKADRILASNSGFYTMPDINKKLPFGLKNTPVNRQDLKNSFRQLLVLLIGEEDDEKETGGILLRSPSADSQGMHRLERGRHFYEQAKKKARAMEAEFRWKMEIVQGVGHDFEKMSDAAARFLYGDK